MPGASPKATPSPPPNLLPFDSNLLFVLDDPISSKASKAGEIVRAHLKNPIVLLGRTIAPAGAPATIKIIDVSPSDILDTYGFVDVFFEPLHLPDGRIVPLRAPIARLSPRVTSGHESTVAAEDTVGDIVVPYYALYQIFRKGKNFVLSPGSVLVAQTQATITELPNGTAAIVTPAPLAESTYIPKATFPVEPVATPFGPGAMTGHHGKPRFKPTTAPSPTTGASPSTSASPATNAIASPAASPRSPAPSPSPSVIPSPSPTTSS
jgi:hypothetical protein